MRVAVESAQMKRIAKGNLIDYGCGKPSIMTIDPADTLLTKPAVVFNLLMRARGRVRLCASAASNQHPPFMPVYIPPVRKNVEVSATGRRPVFNVPAPFHHTSVLLQQYFADSRWRLRHLLSVSTLVPPTGWCLPSVTALCSDDLISSRIRRLEDACTYFDAGQPKFLKDASRQCCQQDSPHSPAKFRTLSHRGRRGHGRQGFRRFPTHQIRCLEDGVPAPPLTPTLMPCAVAWVCGRMTVSRSLRTTWVTVPHPATSASLTQSA